MATTILFGERSRTLRFDIAAMLELEAAMGGKSTGEILASLASWSFTSLVLVLWAGLLHEDRQLTPKLVRKYLTTYVDLPGADLRQLRKDVSGAIEASAWFKQAYQSEEDGDAEEDAAGKG